MRDKQTLTGLSYHILGAHLLLDLTFLTVYPYMNNAQAQADDHKGGHTLS